ncbi:pilus assembly protein [Erythrobacter sp. SDW2]|uniref:TadE/TadG family type IV pilus assembly protein n=1 Tax=Erythrobacter sp. SDW2 TaxID=2907154 RepID=UPI001F1F532E|nr:TadE/TadG family type IV pilus assembly protein [Erythrobacter sp. SDW2]UIP08045.1 pilus assembly protein [Erythrobacter sp. SDW2]
MTIRPALLQCRRLLRALRDTRGVAMVEFAFIAPLILFMGVVGIEMANYAVTSLRISQAAMHIADNGSRIGERGTLSAQRIYESDINDLFIGVRLQAGESIDLYETGRVIVSSLERNADGGQWIHWQRCMGKLEVDSSDGPEGTGETGTDFAGMGEDGAEVTAEAGQAVIYVELIYQYRPLMDNGFTQPFLPSGPIRSTAAFNVRNTRDLTGIFQRPNPSEVASCDEYEEI